MKAQKDIEKKIKQKEEETQRIREDLYRAEAYLEAMQESLRIIKKTAEDGTGVNIRPGSMIDSARTILRKAGEPLHVEELLRRMGGEVTKNKKMSLSGSLGTYVRDGVVFTRPGPNTFGLSEFDEPSEDDIPNGFGAS